MILVNSLLISTTLKTKAKKVFALIMIQGAIISTASMMSVNVMEGKAVFKGFHERNLALSMESGGMTSGLNASEFISEFSSTLKMGEHAREAFTSTFVNTSANTVIGGQNLGDAFVESGVSAAGSYGMAKLVGATGDAFKAGKIEQVQRYTQHALSGFAVGAATNSVLGRDVLNGALSGAFGAVSGELIADWHVKGAEGKVMTAAELSSFKSRTVFFSGVTAALISSALQLDQSMAAGVGSVAASENSLRLALGLAPHVIAALEAAGYTLAVYNGVQDAKENGAASGAVTGATEAGFMFVGGKIIPVVVNAASTAFKGSLNCLRSVGASVSSSFGAKSASVLGKGGSVVKDAATQNIWHKQQIYTIKGKTNKVYQRDDLIDLERVDPDSGLTNLDLMKIGRAPICKDYQPVNLHHLIQTQEGGLAEITAGMHRENYKTLHIWTDKSVSTTGRAEIIPQIDRSSFDKWRSEYWKIRAIELDGK